MIRSHFVSLFFVQVFFISCFEIRKIKGKRFSEFISKILILFPVGLSVNISAGGRMRKIKKNHKSLPQNTIRNKEIKTSYNTEIWNFFIPKACLLKFCQIWTPVISAGVFINIKMMIKFQTSKRNKKYAQSEIRTYSSKHRKLFFLRAANHKQRKK